MTNLDVDDYKYFDVKFNEIYSRITNIDKELDKVKLEAERRLTEIETFHTVVKETKTGKKRDLINTLSIIGAYVTILVMFVI